MSSQLNAQINLIPNPGFEDTVTCPTNLNRLNNSKYWINPTASSPDYFNSCNTNIVSIPSNSAGFQNAYDGNAYAGFAAFANNFWPSNQYREYVQTKLDSALIKDESYCLTFYVSLAEIWSDYAVNNIGAYFSPIAVSSINYDTLPFVPQIINPSTNPLTDTSSWTMVAGQFTALGGENYVTIGNFNGNKRSDTVYVHKISLPFNETYYYIDNVSVTHLDAGAGKAKGVCNNIGTTIGRPAQPGIAYKWSPSTGLSDTAIAQPIASPTVTTTYYLRATLTSSGCTKTDSVTVYYIPTAPTAAISLSNGELCTGEKGTAVAITNSTASPYTYSWNGGVPGSGFQVSDLVAGNYTVTITDALSCTATATATITTKNPCECGEDVFVANIFSPNNDGKNDVLYIEGNGLTNVYWGIYDRWGNLVFETKDATKGWDGLYNGTTADAGVYMYYLRGTCVKTNNAVSLKGNVSLIR